nr:MAG TPA: hypothetical protein [Bacteriophage sp.]
MHHRKPLRKNRNSGTRKNNVDTTNEIRHLQPEFVITPQKKRFENKKNIEEC